ncbi:M20/M25/M40 family metallo-hydrolase [Streptomyces sp. HC307]|uniref:M20/M25/M40 family metallo-hydrolase n=1 Tax=Streptomyces flavusporus TaxID=3385496 RepID=UPI0039173B0B
MADVPAQLPPPAESAALSPSAALSSPARLTPADHDLLLDLLDTPTAGPLETGADGPAVRLWDAGRAYAAAAATLGLRVLRHAPAEPGVLRRDDVPLTVREAAEDETFLARQPSLVLRLGPELPRRDTVMFNVHLDTVAGWWPAHFDGRRFTGRGAIDAKGPAVALLAGIRAARAAEPALGSRVGVLIQAVAGEEGGAMGTFGTRPLVEHGFTGGLNLFCEPTGHRFLPRSTASMTALVRVDGEDAVDDRPAAGHNATVLLGHISHYLARALPPRIGDGRVCVAGLYTGERHNRVYAVGCCSTSPTVHGRPAEPPKPRCGRRCVRRSPTSPPGPPTPTIWPERPLTRHGSRLCTGTNAASPPWTAEAARRGPKNCWNEGRAWCAGPTRSRPSPATRSGWRRSPTATRRSSAPATWTPTTRTPPASTSTWTTWTSTPTTSPAFS